MSSILRNFTIAYFPFIRRDKKRILALRTIIRKIKKTENQYFAPVSKVFNPVFANYLAEQLEISQRIKPLYAGNILGDDQAYGQFIDQLTGYQLGKYGFTLESFSFKAILEQAKAENNISVKNIDGIFSGRIKTFKYDAFRKCREELIDHQVIADLVSFDLEGLISIFLGKKEDSFSRLSAEMIEENLRDLYFILAQSRDIRISEDDSFLTVAAGIIASDDDEPDTAGYSLLINKLLSGYSILLEKEFLSDVLKLTTEDPWLPLEVNSYNSDYPQGIYNTIIEEYKKKRQLFIRNENQKLLNARIQALFGDKELLHVDVYNSGTNSLFNDFNVAGFKYINPFRICKSYFCYFFNPKIMPMLQELSLKAEFKDAGQSAKLNDLIGELSELSERIRKFEEDLTTQSFSEVNPHIEKFKIGILDKTDKFKAGDAIDRVDKRADKIIQDSFRLTSGLYEVVKELLADMKDKNPRLLANTAYFINSTGPFFRTLEGSVKYSYRFTNLLRMFSVDIEETKKFVKK